MIKHSSNLEVVSDLRKLMIELNHKINGLRILRNDMNSANRVGKSHILDAHLVRLDLSIKALEAIADTIHS